MKLTALILTFNEELHIARSINSVLEVADEIIVVDSGSSDNTVNIAKKLGARVLTNPFVTQARQFNWALSQLSPETDWVFRLDADEIITPQLSSSLKNFLANAPDSVMGAEVGRYMTFLGKKICWGGVFPVPVVRLFRFGKGKSEDRWMDEHIVVDGEVAHLSGGIVDDNQQPLSWWVSKHNHYANREAIEILNEKYQFLDKSSNRGSIRGHMNSRRWLKKNLYHRLPVGIRAFAYFFYRYFIRLGFLDGWRGTAFHFLQGFWYRYLVDIKTLEVEQYIRINKVDAKTAIHVVFNIDLS